MMMSKGLNGMGESGGGLAIYVARNVSLSNNDIHTCMRATCCGVALQVKNR